ncbi:uncharacterized protein LOC107610837 [Arachis ipaensis]|uniref:uncharacterized protein LOC107610837 n=1 Tax=Arachis ipaensis TaxID=130454 RepID=UPI0007AFC7BE|nr:uncharacterized protein LOC107610837 [Arachis ipaensis]XP_025670098.1 uncharacterized protein LOC112769857 [Arachis hypogaea]
MVDKYFTSHKLSKSVNGKMVSSIILDSKFWQDCVTTVKIVGPLIKLLRVIDADEKPSLGYVYEGMQRAKSAIKTTFRNRKTAYTLYTSILKMRWDKHLKRDLHAAAYFLNPAFFYSEGFVEKLYRDRKESFGRESALRAIKRLEPGECWRLPGGSAPCKKWLFIFFIKHLLHPIWMLHHKKKKYDPIDIQSIDTVDFWIMTDEDDPEFTNGDIKGIESLKYTDNAMPSYPKDGGDLEVGVNMPDVVTNSSNTASFGGTSEDGGFRLPVYDRDI